MQHLPTLVHLTLVANSVSENWKGSEKKTEPADKISPDPITVKRDFSNSALAPRTPLLFSIFLGFFSGWMRQRRVGGKAGGWGWEQDFNKESLQQRPLSNGFACAKNNISSMLPIRIRSVGPHHCSRPPPGPQHEVLLMLMSPVVTVAPASPPTQFKEKCSCTFLSQRQGARSRRKWSSEEASRVDTSVCKNHPPSPNSGLQKSPQAP